MNNNRNNNRRRGRGNRQQGGGNQNRIDSRARGNAPQMLDKYKKLAQDAAHHGDRVQAEYYLQFADHYFRVIADNKARQDEQRGGNRNDRDDDDSDGDDEFDGGRQQGRRDDGRNDGRGDGRNDRGNDRQRQRGPRRDEDFRSRYESDDDGDGESTDLDAGGSDYEPADNPFVRDNRSRGRERDTGSAEDGRRPRGRRANGRERDESPVGDQGEIDAAALPPSFSAPVEAAEDDEAPAAPKRKLPPRRRRPTDDDTLKAVG